MQRTKMFFSRAAKAYCARYTFGGKGMHQKRGLPCPRAFKILTGYNGFRGSICVTNGYYGTHPTHSYEHVDMRETGFYQSVYSVDCVKRNLTSVFRTSLMISKHMLKTNSFVYFEAILQQITFDYC